jgi:hypothetical protein
VAGWFPWQIPARNRPAAVALCQQPTCPLQEPFSTHPLPDGTKEAFRNSLLRKALGGGRYGARTCDPSLSSNRTGNASDTSKGLTPTTSAVCTSVCTSEAENDHAGTLDAGALADHADPLVKLAAALLTLSPTDRQRLAAMLTGQQAAGEGERGNA